MFNKKPGLAEFNNAATLNSQLVEEQQMRNELFAGAQISDGTSGGGNAGTTSQSGPGSEPTVGQLVQQAQKEHKATTQTAQRALKVSVPQAAKNPDLRTQAEAVPKRFADTGTDEAGAGSNGD